LIARVDSGKPVRKQPGTPQKNRQHILPEQTGQYLKNKDHMANGKKNFSDVVFTGGFPEKTAQISSFGRFVIDDQKSLVAMVDDELGAKILFRKENFFSGHFLSAPLFKYTYNLLYYRSCLSAINISLLPKI
jgi:hypothetical protein